MILGRGRVVQAGQMGLAKLYMALGYPVRPALQEEHKLKLKLFIVDKANYSNTIRNTESNKYAENVFSHQRRTFCGWSQAFSLCGPCVITWNIISVPAGI